MALSLLVDFLDEAPAWGAATGERIVVPDGSQAFAMHQPFKRHFMVTLDEDDGWEIQEDEILAWMKRQAATPDV